MIQGDKMPTITELTKDQCHFALTDSVEPNRYGIAQGSRTQGVKRIGDVPLGDSYPHLFCGEPVAGEGEPYCCKHKRLCHRGPGKHVRSLEEMIYATDDTMHRIGRGRIVDGKGLSYVHGQRESDNTMPLDEAVRRGEAA
jgi:hypothetical protein